MEDLLKPIDKIRFEICLYITEQKWQGFLNKFVQEFKQLSKDGSYISQVEIYKHGDTDKSIEDIEVEGALGILSNFEVMTAKYLIQM